MKTKNSTVQCEFDPRLTDFLIRYLEPLYTSYGEEMVITSGTELGDHHSYKSLHWDKKAADLRTRYFEDGVLDSFYSDVYEARDAFCEEAGIPSDWVDIVRHSTHLHVEIQPKAVR